MAEQKPKPERSGLPWWDIVLLPLLAAVTAALVIAPAELAARVAYPDEELDACVTNKGPVPHGTAKCESRTKTAEGPWVTNDYNDCGYRSPTSCGPKPPGALRVAIIGSSTGGGFLVPYPQTMAGRVPTVLSTACQRPVEIQNLAVAGMAVKKMTLSAREALTLTPDALVVVVTSSDLLRADDNPGPKSQSLFSKAKAAAQAPISNSRLLYMTKVLVLSREVDYEGFIKAQKKSDAALLEETAAGVRTLDAQLTEITQMAKATNTPVVVLFTPRREEMVRARIVTGDSQPAPITNALQALAASHGAAFVNTLAAVPKDVPSSSLYYVVNHHMNGAGHAYIAKALESGLRTSVPAFQTCAQL